MSDEFNCVRLVGSPITHLVAWSDNTSGYVRCGIDFWWRPDDHQTNTWTVASVVEGDCDCMTCLVGSRVKIRFELYTDPGMSVINYGAVTKLNFPDEE